MKTTRIGMVALLGAALGFTVQGCFASQPLPECTISDAQANTYLVRLTRTDTTACTNHLQSVMVDGKEVATMELGAQRYHAPNSKDYSIAFKPATLVDMIDTGLFTGFTDPANDCTASDNGCDLCVTTASDGGLVLGLESADYPAGTAVIDCGNDAGFSVDDGTGACTAGVTVDTANTCVAVADTITRSDSSDPTGKNVVGKAKIPAFPDSKGVCAATDITGTSQSFDAVPASGFGITSGNAAEAIDVKYEWSEFRIFNTTKVPSTAWKAKVKYTEGSCVANYDVVAIWPVHGCDTDADCAPEADADAGRNFGSGINPFFKPKCEKTVSEAELALIGANQGYDMTGVCVPTVDPETLK